MTEFTRLFDAPLFNFIFAVIIAAEWSFAYLLRRSRPRDSSRVQSLIGLSAAAQMGVLGVVTATAAMLLGIVGGAPGSSLFFISIIAGILRVSILVFSSTFIWHEWKGDED